MKKTHGYTGTSIYCAWKNMKARCYNSTNEKEYKHYGGRGIIVCDEWINDPQAFITWAFEHGYKEGLEIDRKNNNGNYEPNNCRFVTRTQNVNNRRNNKVFTYSGLTKTVSEWNKHLGFERGLIQQRLKRGWTFARSIETNNLRPYLINKKGSINYYKVI